MAKFKVAVSWEISGELNIEAENLSDAIKIAEEDMDIPLPDGEYVDGSFKVDPEMSKLLNELLKKRLFQ